MPVNEAPAAVVVDSVTKSFGGVKALAEVSLRAEPGMVSALIGPNGSGKTTLLNLISGVYRPDAGSVHIDEALLSSGRPHRSARLGVARTFQTPLVPPGLTALEAVACGRYSKDYVSFAAAMLHSRGFKVASTRDRELGLAALEAVGIASIAAHEAAALPLGTRRMVEVARALVGGARVILLDEPASGLSEAEITHLAGVVRKLKESGRAVVLVEHHFSFVAEVADVVHVLDLGRHIASGPPEEIRQDAAVLQGYLGGDPDVVAG